MADTGQNVTFLQALSFHKLFWVTELITHPYH